MTTQSVQVKIELGHKAELRRKHSIEGFTHDWTIFVRGPEGSNIQHFVEKVIFYLHDSFPKPKRVKKEPPYQVSESGYGSFNLPVEIYFKTKEEPRKIRFDYDLFLHLDGAPPVNHTRCEKLTFKNPTEEFRRKLIAAGGVGILSSHEGLVQPSSQRTTTTTAITPQTAESKAFNDLFGAPIHAPTAPAPEGGAAAPTRAPTMAPSGSSEGKHKHHGDGHKKHKSHKDKDKDRDHRKKSKSSKSHSSSGGGGGGGTSNSGSQPVTSTPKVSPHASAGASQQPQPAKKHSSEEPTAALSEVPAKKKKKDKDKDAERSKSSSRGHSSERHDKPHKSSSKPDKPTASVAPTTSHDKSSSSSKDKHRHSSTSSKSHHKSKKSHKEKHHHHHRHHDNSSGSSSSKHHSSSSHSKTAETESRLPAKLSPAKSSPAKLSPVKSSPAAKSPVKEPRSQSGYKKPKSIQDKPAPSLPPLEFSTGELSDDPFDEEPATRDDNSEDEVEITDVVVSPDARNTSQPMVPDKVDNRSKDFMKALFDEMDSDEEDDDEEDMDVEVVTPKASPVVIVDSLPAALSPLHPSPKATPAMLSPSPRSHTLSPKPARGLSPQKTPENKPSESSSRRNKSHTSSSPSNVSPLTSSSSSSQRPSVDPSRKHNKSRESSSSVKSKPPTESSSSKQPSSGSRSRREQPVEQHEATKRKSSMDPTSNQDPWGGSPQSGGRNRSREERQESWQSASNTASSNSLLASSKSKISPPRFSMDPPDLLKSTQHSDFGFQASQQRNVPDLEKENQGVENHHNNATTGAVTKAPLLENGTDLPETIPGHAPNGETFDLLLWLQDKLNATKDEAVLSEVVRILEDSGEVFSMTDSSLDFDLCYLNSNTVHRLKTCLQMA